MKKPIVLIISAVLIAVLAGCTSAPTAKVPATAPVKKVIPAVIDFGPYWTGALRTKKESNSDLGSNAEVRFYSEWTMGENAGNVYPKQFTESTTGDTVKLDAKWDNGGDVPAGIYNVVVDVVGMPGKGTIKNLTLEKGVEYEIYISFKAAKVDMKFKTDGDDLFVYPAGTYNKYKNLGRLDNIPEELLINHINSYTENNALWWLVPAGVPLDILRTYSNRDAKWFTDFTAVPESFIKKLQE